jgi:hypothetical protein
MVEMKAAYLEYYVVDLMVELKVSLSAALREFLSAERLAAKKVCSLEFWLVVRLVEPMVDWMEYKLESGKVDRMVE